MVLPKKQNEKLNISQDSNKINNVSEEIKNSFSKIHKIKILTNEKLEKIKEAAHSNKLDMENKISTRQEEEFRNKKFQDKKNKTDSIKDAFKANKKFQTSTMPEKHH